MGTIPKSNIKIGEWGKWPLPWTGTGPSIKSDGVNLV
jgi:hypothetical protein